VRDNFSCLRIYRAHCISFTCVMPPAAHVSKTNLNDIFMRDHLIPSICSISCAPRTLMFSRDTSSGCAILLRLFDASSTRFLAMRRRTMPSFPCTSARVAALRDAVPAAAPRLLRHRRAPSNLCRASSAKLRMVRKSAHRARAVDHLGSAC